MSGQMTVPSVPRSGRSSGQFRSVDDVLFSLAAAAAKVLAAEGAAVWSGNGGTYSELVTATTEPVAQLERLQISLGEGPSRDALVTAAPVRSDDLGSEDRWPRFRPAALRQGFQGAVSVPIVRSDGIGGGLTLYTASSRRWAHEELAVAAFFGGVAVDHSTMAGELRAAQVLAGQLQRALDSRIPIEQAKGITSKSLGIGIDDAFELLRGYARATSTKLHEICVRVVDGGLDPRELGRSSGDRWRSPLSGRV